MEDYEIAELVSLVWPKYQKDVPDIQVTNKGVAMVSLAYEIADFRIIHGISIGLRGRLTESFLAVDPTKHPVADQVICNFSCRPRGLVPSFLITTDLHDQCKGLGRAEKLDLFKRCLVETKEYLSTLHRTRLESDMVFHQSYAHSSISTVPGCYGTSPRR